MERSTYAAGRVAVVIAVAILAPALYLLSVGPAVWLLNRGLLSERPVEVVYLPIEWAADSCEPFMAALEWYIELFDQSSAAPAVTVPATAASSTYCPSAPVPAAPSDIDVPFPAGAVEQ